MRLQSFQFPSCRLAPNYRRTKCLCRPSLNRSANRMLMATAHCAVHRHSSANNRDLSLDRLTSSCWVITSTWLMQNDDEPSDRAGQSDKACEMRQGHWGISDGSPPETSLQALQSYALASHCRVIAHATELRFAGYAREKAPKQTERTIAEPLFGVEQGSHALWRICYPNGPQLDRGRRGR